LDWSWVVALAKEAGVPGAALLIFILGVSFNLHKILEVVRAGIRDSREQNRLDRELTARIERESGKARQRIEKIKTDKRGHG
jgi:hypothetical protein